MSSTNKSDKDDYVRVEDDANENIADNNQDDYQS